MIDRRFHGSMLLALLAVAATSLGAVPAAPHVGSVHVPFIENLGQVDSRVAFYAPTARGKVFVTKTGEIVYSLDASSAPEKTRWSLVETPVGGRARIGGERCAVTRVSSFIGNDPSRWRSGASTYDTVGLGVVWPGVSLSLRAYGNNVEKLFTVAPGANPSRIRMRVAGARSLRVDESGALVAKTGLGDVTFTRPLAYQERDGVRRAVAVAYRAKGRQYGFSLGAHDPALPVIIDPLLQSTYLGGSGSDGAGVLAIDPVSGDVFVAGNTTSTDFPGTAGGEQPASGGGYDVFIARLDSALTTLLQATYLGGSADEGAAALAIDPASGDVFVAGATNSTDFPGTAGGAQPAYGGGDNDGFVARLNAALTMLNQATYLGGSANDYVSALAIHPTTGEVFLAGSALHDDDFPGTAGGAQPTFGGGYSDGFVARLNATLTTLNQATYLGGNDEDFGIGLAIHPVSGEAFVTGLTRSEDFPGTAGGAQPGFGAALQDAFIARLDATLTTLNQSTYLGGANGANQSDITYNYGYAVAIHPTTGEVYVSGLTFCTDFPGTGGGAQPGFGGGDNDGFVARLNAALTVLNQATYVGGNDQDFAVSLAFNPTTGDVLVAGTTYSTDFPGTAGGAQPAFGGAGDAFVARFNGTLTKIDDETTYLGGSDSDGAGSVAIHPTTGDVFVAGSTKSIDFPGTTGGAQPANGGGLGDAFVARLTGNLAGDLVISPASGPATGGTPVAIYGSLFQAGATVTIGAVAATGVGFVDFTRLTATTPALTPGTFNDVVVTNPDNSSFTLPAGFFADLLDVPQGDIFHDDVETIFRNGITAGCGNGNYCRDDPVRRDQMAVFLLKAEHGSAYVPPACAGVFPDVTCPSLFADWIEQLSAEGTTGGCGGGNYCPASPVTRQQMAVFLLKTEHGTGYAPPACLGIFGDVACPSLFADWIEQLAAEQITGGCSSNPPLYCPGNSVTRGQMSAFLTKTFALQ